MVIESETRKFRVKYTPLDVSCEIIAFGGVADRQSYNSRDGGFSPDYTKTHLCLFPKCNATNPNTEGSSEYINDKLTGVAWYELVYDSTKKKYVRGKNIVTSDAYQVIGSSADGLIAGMLIVKKNSSVNEPLRFEFEASYADDRTKQIIRYMAQKSIFCDDTEKPVPILHVSPTVVDWNPLTEVNNITFEAMLTDGKTEVTNNKNTRFFWYRKTNINGDTYSLELITGSADKDIDVVSISTKIALVDGKEVTVFGNQLTINPDLVGDAEYYVCRTMYRVDGLKSSDTLNDLDAKEELAVLRKMPPYKPSYSMVGDTDDEDMKYINPMASVAYRNTEVTNIEEFFRIRWYTKAHSDSDFKLAAEGINPQIPFVDGMSLKMTAEDKGATKILVDDSGNYLVDENGAYLVTK